MGSTATASAIVLPVADREALYVRVDADVMARLRVMAKANDRSIAAETRRALAKHVDDRTMAERIAGNLQTEAAEIAEGVAALDQRRRDRELAEVRESLKPNKERKCPHPKSARQSVAGGAAYICRDCGVKL